MTFSAATLSKGWQDRAPTIAPIVTKLLLLAAIGVEILALVAWLPETLDIWLTPKLGEIGDFGLFYDHAEANTTIAKYSPGLILLFKPLSWLDVLTAYQVFAGINVAALLTVAYLAQRPLTSPVAKIAMFLGVLALPQFHWAIRLGHFVPVMALLALSGFLLADRRPVLAGVCFALLALKPQYLPIPLLYILFTRNWRAVAGAFGTLAVLSIAGLFTVGSKAFFGQLTSFTRISLDITDVFLPVQQAWQYSWAGFLISAGFHPNPLVVADLMLLSIGAVVLVWATRPRPTAKVAAALGMLLMTPYSTFYNWGLIAVAAALLVRSDDLRPRAWVPALLGAGAIAMAATQKATPFPTLDLIGAGGTQGLYWAAPFALLTLFVLATAGRNTKQAPSEEPIARTVPARETLRRAWRALRPPQIRAWAPGGAVWAAAAVVALTSGFVVAGFVSQSGPFKPGPFSRQTVLRALPDDFPVPADTKLHGAGRGTLLPYQVDWETTLPVADVFRFYEEQLSEGIWTVLLAETDEASVSLRTARFNQQGEMDVFADVRALTIAGGSAVTLQFTLIPTNRVPEFDRWLAERDELQSGVLGTESPSEPASP